MEKDSATIVFRIPQEQKAAIEAAAKAEDQTVSQLLRGFIRWKIEKHAEKNTQTALLNALHAKNSQPKPEPSPQPETKPLPDKKGLLGISAKLAPRTTHRKRRK